MVHEPTKCIENKFAQKDKSHWQFSGIKVCSEDTVQTVVNKIQAVPFYHSGVGGK